MHDEDIVDGLVVLRVEPVGDDVFVDLYGSDDCVCASTRFTFTDPAERRSRVATLERWRDRETVVTLSMVGTTLGLVDASAALRRALT